VGIRSRQCLGKIVGTKNREFLRKKFCAWVPKAESILGRLLYQKQRVSFEDCGWVDLAK
jgi:hypothetical protein